MPIISNFRQWRNGEVFNANDYVYERNAVVNQLNRLTAILEGSGTPVDLTVDELTASSITMDGQTITSFADVGGTKIHYETLSNPSVDDLFIDYD